MGPSETVYGDPDFSLSTGVIKSSVLHNRKPPDQLFYYSTAVHQCH